MFQCKVYVSGGVFSCLQTSRKISPPVMSVGYDLLEDFSISGDYIPAGELIETASYVNGVLTVPGRDVVKI